VPPYLRDTHYPGAARLGAGNGYQYPHDFPGGVVRQQYAPDVIAGKVYYEPTEQEPEAAARARAIERVLRGTDGDQPAG
jgi:putative ATPase